LSASGESFELKSPIETLVIGRTDEGLERIAKFNRVLSADVRIERSYVLEDFDHLEVIGGRVPCDQNKIFHARVVPAVGHELLEQWFRLVDKVGNYIDMRNDYDFPEAVASRRRAYQERKNDHC
jgi:hypothetical protein